MKTPENQAFSPEELLSNIPPVTVILRAAYINPDGTRERLTHRDFRNHVQEQMNRLQPTDAGAAGRVAAILEKLWGSSYSFRPNSQGIARHKGGGGYGELKDYPAGLTENEKKVLAARSSETGEKRTLKDVASEIGLSTGRVRQLEARGLAKTERQKNMPLKPALYDALTIERYDPEEMRRIGWIGEKTVKDVGVFLAAEVNPELVLNGNQENPQLEFEWPEAK